MSPSLPGHELADAPDLSGNRIRLCGEKLPGDVIRFLLASKEKAITQGQTRSTNIGTIVPECAASDRMRCTWAEAMLDRYGKVPGDSEWAADPIVSRLNDRASSEVRQSLIRFAAEAQSKRQRR